MAWSGSYSRKPPNRSLLFTALGTRHPLLLFLPAAQRPVSSQSSFIDGKTGTHLIIKPPGFTASKQEAWVIPKSVFLFYAKYPRQKCYQFLTINLDQQLLSTYHILVVVGSTEITKGQPMPSTEQKTPSLGKFSEQTLSENFPNWA